MSDDATVNSITEVDAKVAENENHRDVYSSIPNFEQITLLREAIFIFFMCMSQLLTQAANAQTMVNSVVLGKAFNVADNAGQVSWFSAAISLTVGTFILVSGRLGDLYGYKKLYIIGYLWFGVFSLLCGFTGFTTSNVFLSTMRGLQGIGPAIMMPNSQALIGNFYPNGRRKNMCFALFGAVAPSGFIVGALFSGLFTDRVWWPWTFWICGIVSISLAILALFVIPAKVGSRSPGKFDYWGSITGVSGLVLINFAFNQGPTVGWEKVYVYVLLIVGFLLMGVFFFVEKKVTDPLVPPEVLRGDTGFILACISAGWSCFGVWLYYQFRWALLVDHDSEVIAAVQNIPCAPVGVIAAVGVAILLSKIPSAVVMFLSMLAFLTGSILMGTRPVGQTFWAQKFVSLLIQPLGMDMSFPAGVILLSAALPRHQQGIAGSLVSTFVNYSISIGLGFAGTVEYYTTKDKPQNFNTTVLGFRNAYRMGMGLAGFGVVVAAVYMWKQFQSRKRDKEKKEFSEKVQEQGQENNDKTATSV
ncbi:hypothetical protein CORT_0D01490 [Candida orthopsilosis Co 90-125]|uniref:Major facilitator superfamily (MFS) profile domain-containing protein n=1 Tax=Candida orthopsilosis (strain 90-125) TaxID=1136231 RepID=H8X4Q5_CANO9|nr:hypothetical protein CORT_0D01490 [Candida orthopsilosis Co 90-125]CCG22997.1 hypothetical protein CORT_0D01490 [Candida orthopsilosis Co 90-125]